MGSQPLLLANGEGFLEEVASEPPLDRETGRRSRPTGNGSWARLVLTCDYPVMINGKPPPSQDLVSSRPVE